MEALVLLIFVTGIYGASPRDDRLLAVQECPADTPWGSGNFSHADCDVRDPLACNGLGTCDCGTCKCKERDNPEETVSGRQCECTNFLCNNFLGLYCSGPDHGQCVCNKCECKPGWTGEDCGCSESVENCKNPLTGEICSNQGICECNSCRQCDFVKGGRCSGKWCENCPDPDRRRRHRNKEEREQRRRERKQRKKQRNGAVSEGRNSTAELCPKDTPWGLEAFDDSSCKETRASSPCSGRGTCTCGQCSCDSTPNHLEIISGQFCECTNFLCDRHNGLLCSGPDHGECICNRCRCKPGWTGEACECEESVENCRNPETGEICSNQGICECNMCRCSASAGGRYSGKWCEDCPTCRGSCLEYKSCVQCQAFGTGDLSEDECMHECKLFNSTMVQVAREETEEERLCTFFDENECRFYFVYGYDEDRNPIVRVQETLDCPPTFGAGAGSTAVSERRDSTAELCPKDTPWGPEAFDDSSCKETRASRPCSGRGTCTCGQCSCDSTPNHLEIISGQFCECTNFLCDRHNGLLCSGPDHGECICNRCRCKPGWTGEACECEDSVENCRNPETGEICSNQGICECNRCRCSASAGGRYSGKWCEDCPTCRGSCLEYKSCVQCQAFGTGDLSEEECIQECKLFNSTMVQVAREETEEERLCTFFDENDCRFTFVYGYDDERDPVVRVKQTLECPPPSFGRGTGSTAVSESRDSTAELCPKDTPWGPEAFDDSSCKETRASSPCSGRGTCACGQCSCDSTPNHLEIISGQFCECTNFLCDRHNGLLCSGPDHGECICNRCRCKPGWTGEACECEESVENCRNPETGEICSNQGICECNMCRCSASAGGRYFGKWCEDCPTCRGSCLEYKSCVQCQAFGTGDLSEDECMQECKLFNSTMVQVAREEIEEERLCTFFDENDCRFTFVYGYDDERDPVVRVKQTLECPPPSFGRGTVFLGPSNKSPTCFARAGEPALFGHCRQGTLRFHYVPERDRCEPVSVCGGNAGTFPSPGVCQRACHTGAPPVSDVSCDRSLCPWSRWSHYLVKKCQPLYDKGFCCPTRFSCPRETQLMRDSTRCYYRGSFYLPGEEVPLRNPCLGTCRCVVGALPAIECQSECQDMDQPGPGCRHLFNPGACCPHAQNCEEQDAPVDPRDKVTCSWGNKTYLEGERMTSDDLPCQACVCTSSFTDITGYGCYKMDCGLERCISKLRSGCTPIFYEKKCCPTDWLCPGDPRISSSSTRKLTQNQEASSQPSCRLGDLTIDIGSKVKIRGRQVICRCVTPPDLTCVRYRSRAEAQRHSRLRKDNCPKLSCDPRCTKVLNEATRCSECSCTANTLSCNEMECPENCRYDIDMNTGCPTCTDCV